MKYHRNIVVTIRATFNNKEHDIYARKALGVLLYRWNTDVRSSSPTSELRIDASWLDAKPKKK